MSDPTFEEKTLDLATKAKEATDKIGRQIGELREKLEIAQKEAVRKDDLDPLFKDFEGKINAELDKNQKAADEYIARLRRLERYGDGAEAKSIETLDSEALKWAKSAARKNFSVSEFTHEDMVEFKQHLPEFLRTGETMPSKFKALSVGNDTTGGYTVHPDMSGRVVTRIFETSPMRQYASVQTIGSDALVGLHDDDEAAASWVSELGSRSESDTPDLGQYRIEVHELHAQPRASQQILDDSDIDIESWLENKVADKFGRTENAAFVTGDASDRPRGFATYADWTTAGTYERGKIEQFDSGANGAFATAPDGGDVLVTALYGLKQQYRNNAVWFMNRTTTGAVRQLKDSNGAYIWQPGIAAGQPATILGYPMANFEDMADYTTTGALAIAVGDMAATYTIVDRIGIRVLRDPYSAKPYVLFDTTKRVGGDVVNFDSLKMIRFSA